jgi:hypothetical protein
MAARKVLAGFAVLVLGAAVVRPVAHAAPSCGRKACSDEVAASGLSGNAMARCLKSVVSQCRAGLCSCTGGSTPCSCVCGDGLCGPSEDCSTCPADCGRRSWNIVCSAVTAIGAGGRDCGTLAIKRVGRGGKRRATGGRALGWINVVPGIHPHVPQRRAISRDRGDRTR